MGGGYVQVDESKRSVERLPQAARRVSEANQTPVRYLAPGHGQTKLGYLWTALSPGGHLPRSSFGKAIDYALSNWSL